MKIRIAVLLAALAATLWATTAHAKPLMEARGDKPDGGVVTLTIYSEPCSLREVTNLPKRATWYVDGTFIEGCGGLNSELGVMVLYFANKRVESVPIQAFKPISGV